MPSVIVDFSPLHRTSNQTAPKKGTFEFQAGEVKLTVENSSLKDALNSARRWARAFGSYRVLVVSATPA